MNERTMPPDKDHNESNRLRGVKPETEEKYRQAIELYRSTPVVLCRNQLYLQGDGIGVPGIYLQISP